MSTASQTNANRLNSKKSTGPKTPEGKAKVSQNAVTHGLTSHRPVLDMEDTAEFRTFVNELLDQLDPTNPLEFFFAKRASCQAWRIQRAQCYETLVLDKLIKSASQSDKTKPNNNTQAPNASTQARNVSDGIDCSLPVQPISTDSPTTRPPRTKITDYIEVDPGLLGEDDDPKSLLGQALMDDFHYHWTLDKLARYETRLENSMIRCLNKFQKVRESKMMNFSSHRQYYRGFQPRPQDFMDDSTPKASCGTAAPGCVQNSDSSNSIPNSAQQPKPSPEKENPDQIENRTSTIENNSDRVQLHQDRSLDVGLLQDPSAQPSQDMPIDSFNHWKMLYCQPRGNNHNYDDSTEVPQVPHRPDIPGDGEYVYRENWQHRVLDMVEYPWNKRNKLTKLELNELVDQILRGFADPRQFLWDFGLIELTAEAIAKRNLPAKAS
jgi:hypothetical protein